MSGRYVDTELERPRWRFTLNYRLNRRLQIGVEYNPAAGEVGPLASLFLLTESDRRPALFLGTSSDRIGSPEGTQSYYLTVAKLLPALPLSAYASLNYSEWDRGFNFPFGGSLEFGRGISARAMYDGRRTHLLLNYFPHRYGVSLIYAWLENFGVAFAVGL